MASLSEIRKNPVVDLVLTVAIAVGIAYLVQAFIVKPYRVPSGSMRTTPRLRISCSPAFKPVVSMSKKHRAFWFNVLLMLTLPFGIVGCLIHHPNGSGPSEKPKKWMSIFGFLGPTQPFGW